jgi:hypothetical protein
MAEQRFFHSPSSVAAPSPTNPNRTGIQISWNEGAVKTIEIRRHHIELATKGCCIKMKPGGRPGHDAQFALNAQSHKMIFASKPERRAT